MNKVLIGLVVVVLLLGGGYYMMQKSQTPAEEVVVQEDDAELPVDALAGETAVEIKDFAFSPATLNVKVGDTVTWTNQDSVGHSATADDGSFDTGILAQGESNTVTFTEAGTFSYHCTPHPNMTATVVVAP